MHASTPFAIARPPMHAWHVRPHAFVPPMTCPAPPAGDAPSASLARAAVEGVTLPDIMVAVGLQPSKGAARK